MKLQTAVLTLIALTFLITSCSDSGDDATTLSLLEEPDAPVAQLGNATTPVGYRLELTIDPAQDRFSGRTEIDIKLSQAAQHVWLHGQNLSIETSSVRQGEKVIPATWEQVLPSGVSKLSLPEPLVTGTATISISYTAAFDRSSNALYTVQRGQYRYAATQLQPIAARQIFPSFDEPRFKVPFDITILARPDDVVVTTTPETSARREGKMMRHEFKRTPPLPTYLLAFVVGPYDLVEADPIPPNSVRDRPLPLRGLTAKGQGAQIEYALANTAGILEILEDYFGIPYPYDKLDLIATPAGFGGAMENVGAIIYDEYLLLLEEDSSINQRRAFVSVHAHELAHMWFGNLVTPDWWTDIWLNESFATWISYKVSNAYWPEGEFDRSVQKGALGAMDNDSLAAARMVREEVLHNDDIMKSFDGITYQKGGGVLGMIERYAGEESFRNGIQHHLTRFSNQVANAPQFMESLAQGAELAEIEPVFSSFINQAGLPLIDVRVDCSEQSSITLSQSRYAPLGSTIDSNASTWQIPVCIKTSADGTTAESCLLLDSKKKTFPLGNTCPDYVHPNAGGSGYYRFALTDYDWQRLLANISALNAGEALAVADSMDAAFRAGTIEAQLYMQGMATLVEHEDWNVVQAATSKLESITNIISSEQLPIMEQAYRNIVGYRFEQSSNPETPGEKLLYEVLQRFMLIIAREPTLRAPLAADAAAYIGFEEEPNPSRIAPGQLETVLSIGVQDLGEPFFDKLVELALNTENPAIRSNAIGSLARVEDPELVKKLQALALSGAFKGTEVAGIIGRQMVRAATTQLTYAFLKENVEQIIELTPGTFRSTTVPGFGGSLCSATQVIEWRNILKTHASLLPGYERSMEQVIEYNELCDGLKSRNAASLITYLSMQ